MIHHNNLAPIIVTAFKRVSHLKQTLESLRKNDLSEFSDLFIYCDGSKVTSSDDEINDINSVRDLAKSAQWCKNVNVIEMKYNLGLVQTFIKSISEIINQYGKVIVLEDDQITSVGFLKYMNQALDMYENEERVMHVSGYMYPATFKTNSSTFFLNVQSCPGWGTWRRAWEKYNHNVHDHIAFFKNNPDEIKHFDLNGFSGWYAQLERNILDPKFSFAVRWYASCYRENGLSLFPKDSLVQNIGLDGTGEHCSPTSMYETTPVDYIKIKKEEIIENKVIRKSIESFYKVNHKVAFGSKLLSSLNNGKDLLKYLVRLPFMKILPELKLKQKVDLVKNSVISSYAKLYSPHRIFDSKVDDYSYISSEATISNTKLESFALLAQIYVLDGVSIL